MKSNRYYVLLVVTVVLTALSFDVAMPTLMDTSEKTEIEISLIDSEDTTEDKMWITHSINIFIKDMPFIALFDFDSVMKSQCYLNKIFKPPKQA